VIPLASSWSAPEPIGRALAAFADHAYATYLVHELARDAVASLLGPRVMPFAVWFAACLVATAIGAVLLRRLVELPGLRWRDRRLQVAPTT
jgi:peptidoglycan/LPS O-acetylase OafA/YrhL